MKSFVLTIFFGLSLFLGFFVTKAEASLIHDVVSAGNSEVLGFMIDRGGNVEDRNEEGYTSLMLAARHNIQNIASLLLESGANVNAKTTDGWTALMMSRSKDIVKLLIDHNAEVDATNNSGETALMLAAKYGEKEFVEVLIDYGANKLMKDRYGHTAFDLAMRFGHHDLAQLICRVENQKRFNSTKSARNQLP